MKIYLVGGGELDGIMRIFLAESEGWTPYIYKEIEDIFIGTNILRSFFYVNEITEKIVLRDCKDFLLDSGAFTFMKSKKNSMPEWNEFIEKYAEFINKNNIEKFFELDIDSIKGYEYVLYLRKKLEKLTNKQCIPVWHPSRGLEEYKNLCRNYPYIALGGINTGEYTASQIKIFPLLINEAHKLGSKIHGLGFTRFSLLPEYHFDSVDSSSWVNGNKFGFLYKFSDGKMGKIKTPPGHRLADPYKVAIHNFQEWKKYCEWAEVHL